MRSTPLSLFLVLFGGGVRVRGTGGSDDRCGVDPPQCGCGTHTFTSMSGSTGTRLNVFGPRCSPCSAWLSSSSRPPPSSLASRGEKAGSPLPRTTNTGECRRSIKADAGLQSFDLICCRGLANAINRANSRHQWQVVVSRLDTGCGNSSTSFPSRKTFITGFMNSRLHTCNFFRKRRYNQLVLFLAALLHGHGAFFPSSMVHTRLSCRLFLRHLHVDKNNSPHYDYSALLYLRYVWRLLCSARVKRTFPCRKYRLLTSLELLVSFQRWFVSLL